MAKSGDVEAVALRGALPLQRALAAAKLDQAENAYAHLQQAKEMAEQVGPGRNDHNTEFGPLNVSLHEIVVAVDLGDAGIALRAAENVDASELSVERQIRFHVNVARAHTQRRQADDALAALTRARTLSPEMVQALPLVRQLVSDLLTIGRPPSDRLRELARELDVADVRL